jgi:hypothetical protein
MNTNVSDRVNQEFDDWWKTVEFTEQHRVREISVRELKIRCKEAWLRGASAVLKADIDEMQDIVYRKESVRTNEAANQFIQEARGE